MQLATYLQSLVNSRAVVAAFASVIALAAGWPTQVIAGDGIPSSEVIFATSFQNPDETFCQSVELSAPFAVPAERVSILNLPEEFRVPEIYASQQGTFLGRLVTLIDGKDISIVAPLLENYESTHTLSLTLTGVLDGELVSCDGLELDVNPLPVAQGDPIQDTVQSLATSIQEFKTLLGVPNIDLNQDPAGLPGAVRLLALADFLVHGTNNKNSLERVMDGTAPVLSQAGITYNEDLLQRLLISSGTVAALQDFAAALEAESAMLPAEAKGTLATLICAEDVTDPDELVECMIDQDRLAALVEDRAKYAVLALTSGLGALAIVFPPAAGVATATGIIVFVVQTLAEVVSEGLPKEVGPLEFDITKDEFFEDEQNTSGTWGNVEMTAKSGETTISWFTFVDAGLQILGPFTSELGSLTRQFFEAAEGVLLEVFMLVAAAANTILDINVPSDASAAITLSPIDYGPVTMSDSTYYDVAVTSIFGSFDVEEEAQRYTKVNIFERAPQSWDLKLESDISRDYFPGGLRATGTATISMPEIDIFVDAPLSASPGEQVDVFASVDQAINQTLTFELQPAFGTLEMGEPTAGTYDGHYTAPTSVTTPTVVTITARHPTITERTQSVQIRVGPEVEISPRDACLEAGEQLQFSAPVVGLTNTDVNWTASAGSITSDGLFTAPATAETIEVTITATAVADAMVTDSVVVRAGPECQCYFRATVTGDTSAYFDGPARIEIANNGAVDITLVSRANINAEIGQSASFNTGPSNPLTPGSYSLAGASYSFPPYNTIYIPGDEDFDCPTCGGTMNIESYEPEQTMVGSATMTMVRAFPPPEPEQKPTATLTVDFIAAYGSVFQGTSPYVRCSIEYGDD